jgi:tetratricopeptide (TPR) repeat protein
MSRWLAQQRPRTGETIQTNGDTGEHPRPTSQPVETLLQPATLAAAYRSIGISKAHWAHLTYDSAERSSILSEAAESLRHAQRLEPGSVDTAHALALVLAATRDIPGAIEVIRGALAGSVMLNGNAASQKTHERERQLLSLWHLLALCLSAQDRYDTAAQICEAAYNQFGNSHVLYGQTAQHAPLDPEKTAVPTSATPGVIAQTGGFERESILQIRMSQVLLVELMEGPDAAIDMTDSLLGLYSRLFGNPEQVTISVSRAAPPAAAMASSRFSGTLRSITGSIRPRSALSRRSSNAEKNVLRRRSVTSADATGDLRPVTSGQGAGAPIAITVTHEDGSPARQKHHSHHLHLPFHKHQSPSARTSAISVTSAYENVQPSEPIATPVKAAQSSNATPEQPLPEIAHNASHDTYPPPVGHSDQPPVQDVRLPARHPVTGTTVPESHLLPLHERRHKVGVLIKTWLFVAGLYMRAESYDDAENAVDQALKLTESSEAEYAAAGDGVNARRLYEKGWGGSKSIDELWADVWSTVSGIGSLIHRILLTNHRKRTSQPLASSHLRPLQHMNRPSRTTPTTAQVSSACRIFCWTYMKRRSPRRSPSPRHSLYHRHPAL